MTVKLMVLYTQPLDGDAFDEHYASIHAPLVEAVPGLERWESARVAGPADGGEQTFHRIAELYFKDMESLEAALGSDEGRATGRDYRQLAPPGSRMFIAALDE
ncbi:EthD family reductase [Streptomyces sp. NPDC060006]|uniref:EthD family reductase n=1 Tax=unclassified Streptomyces TaxID=2593676 RepID=UPI0036CEE414